MLFNLFLTVAAAALSSATPLQKRSGLSAANLENSVLLTADDYRSVADHAGFFGQVPNIAKAVIGVYNDTVNAATPLPAPSGPAFAVPIQFALCDAETMATLQELETQTVLRENVDNFTKPQKKQITSIVTRDKAANKAYGPAFAKYVPVCSSTILHNVKLTQESYNVTIGIFDGQL